VKWGFAFGLVLLLGCTGGRLERRGGDPPDDEDASIRFMDSGPEEDSGGGPGVDGGGPGVDSGGGAVDAFRPRRDAGPPPADCDPAPEGVTDDARAAYTLENETRRAMGVPCARMDTAINLAAERHCQYYDANRGNAMCISNPHGEVMGCAMYVAANFWERMSIAGYMGGPSGEDMHFVGNGAAAVQGWIDSVWHRTPVLSPWVRDIGYGSTGGCDTMDFGNGAPADRNIVAVYPYDGQTGVPTSFDGRREGPNPPMPPTGWPSGYPVHIYIQGELTTHTIVRDGTTTNLDHLWIAPGTPESLGLLRNEYSFYTHEPLQSGTTYRVHVTGTNGAGPVDLEWTFTTR
jgi:hypothetical protein